MIDLDQERVWRFPYHGTTIMDPPEYHRLDTVLATLDEAYWTSERTPEQCAAWLTVRRPLMAAWRKTFRRWPIPSYDAAGTLVGYV